MDANVPDPSQVVIDTGSGICIELPLKEATTFIDKKVFEGLLQFARILSSPALALPHPLVARLYCWKRS